MAARLEVTGGAQGSCPRGPALITPRPAPPLTLKSWLRGVSQRLPGKESQTAQANGGNAAAAVAVIGAGIMGSAMARNLVAAGLDTRVWDRSSSVTAPLAEAGAVAAPSARDAGR